MLIHTDTLTADDLTAAAKLADCRVESVSHHRSSARHHALKFMISGHGKIGGAYGRTAYPVGSWDDYGILLAELFRRDPRALVGTPGRPTYDGAADFHDSTAHRYETLTPADAHHSHTRRNGADWRQYSYVTERGYYLTQCRRCPAYI